MAFKFVFNRIFFVTLFLASLFLASCGSQVTDSTDGQGTPGANLDPTSPDQEPLSLFGSWKLQAFQCTGNEGQLRDTVPISLARKNLRLTLEITPTQSTMILETGRRNCIITSSSKISTITANEIHTEQTKVTCTESCNCSETELNRLIDSRTVINYSLNAKELKLYQTLKRQDGLFCKANENKQETKILLPSF